VQVVEHFDLMLDAEAAAALHKQIEIVFQHVAQVGSGIRNTDLVALSPRKQTVAGWARRQADAHDMP